MGVQLLLAPLAFAVLAAPLGAAAGPVIGYGSSDAVLSAKTQEIFYLGFELGLSMATKRADVGPLLAVEHAWDGSPLGARRSAEKLLKRGVTALVGYPTSQDALLASKASLDSGVMAVFAAARHSSLGGLGPKVASTVPSMAFDIESFMRFIKVKYPGKRGLIVSNPYNVFCKNQEELFVGLLKEERFKDMDVEVVRLGKDMTLSDEALARVGSGGFGYLFLTTYPDSSVRLLDQLAPLGLDLPLFANASWTTDDFELIRRLLVKHKAPVYSVALWLPGSERSLPFEKAFRKRFGRDPSSEAAYGFDLGVVVGTALGRVKGPVTARSFFEAFYRAPCFDGSSSGEICFSPSGGHAKRALTFVRFAQGGFVPVAGPR